MRNWARHTKVGSSAWAVGLMLMVHADPAGDSHPSIAMLMAETHLSERAVRRALRELEAAGDIVTTHHKGAVSGYHLTSTPATSGPPTPARNGTNPGQKWPPEVF